MSSSSELPLCLIKNTVNNFITTKVISLYKNWSNILQSTYSSWLAICKICTKQTNKQTNRWSKEKNSSHDFIYCFPYTYHKIIKLLTRININKHCINRSSIIKQVSRYYYCSIKRRDAPSRPHCCPRSVETMSTTLLVVPLVAVVLAIGCAAPADLVCEYIQTLNKSTNMCSSWRFDWVTIFDAIITNFLSGGFFWNSKK